LTATEVAPPLLGSHDCHATPNCSTLSGLRRTLRWLLVLRRSGCNARTGPRIFRNEFRVRTLGPVWAQLPRLAITERLLAIGATATFTLGGDAPPIPADLGLRVREFKSRQPDITRADLRHSDVKDGLVIRVETTARHRRVLMASTRWRRCSSAPVSAIHVTTDSGDLLSGKAEPASRAPDGDSHKPPKIASSAGSKQRWPAQSRL
jgi:hypothetical protein